VDARIVVVGVVVFILGVIFLPAIAFLGLPVLIYGLTRRKQSPTQQQRQNLPPSTRRIQTTTTATSNQPSWSRYRPRPPERSSPPPQQVVSQTPSWAQTPSSYQPPQMTQTSGTQPQEGVSDTARQSPSEALNMLRNYATSGAQSEEERSRVNRAFSLVNDSLSSRRSELREGEGESGGLFGDPVITMMLMGLFVSSFTRQGIQSSGERAADSTKKRRS
jgi:hypothetical protein